MGNEAMRMRLERAFPSTCMCVRRTRSAASAPPQRFPDSPKKFGASRPWLLRRQRGRRASEHGHRMRSLRRFLSGSGCAGNVIRGARIVMSGYLAVRSTVAPFQRTRIDTVTASMFRRWRVRYSYPGSIVESVVRLEPSHGAAALSRLLDIPTSVIYRWRARYCNCFAPLEDGAVEAEALATLLARCRELGFRPATASMIWPSARRRRQFDATARMRVRVSAL